MEILLATNGQRGRMVHARVMNSAVAVVRRWFLVTVQNILRPHTRTADISSDFEGGFSYLQFSCLSNSTANENECGVTWKMFPWTLSLTNTASLLAISCPCSVSVHADQFRRTDTMQDCYWWSHVHNKWTKSLLLSLCKCMCYVSGPGEGGVRRIIDKWLARIWRWADSYKLFLDMRTPVQYHPKNLSVLFCFHAVCMCACMFINVSSTKSME